MVTCDTLDRARPVPWQCPWKRGHQCRCAFLSVANFSGGTRISVAPIAHSAGRRRPHRPCTRQARQREAARQTANAKNEQERLECTHASLPGLGASQSNLGILHERAGPPNCDPRHRAPGNKFASAGSNCGPWEILAVGASAQPRHLVTPLPSYLGASRIAGNASRPLEAGPQVRCGSIARGFALPVGITIPLLSADDVPRTD
jgi:hypothetical protein